ncbi:hypothetical protein BVC80_1661g3 [Macleaya cordata]|uniref:Uncharacterized protein n=1 Tax=Macleaya cordata TaxID=56857 RepID=A0A200RBU4_MACCD|nr:hypothetical protein BVC80_1661g3 [Macleaya cordata]
MIPSSLQHHLGEDICTGTSNHRDCNTTTRSLSVFLTHLSQASIDSIKIKTLLQC